MYECLPCAFKSIYKNDFRRHLESKKHITNCLNILVCKKCLTSFKNQGAYGKHIKSCDINLCPVRDIKNAHNTYNHCTVDNSENIYIHLPPIQPEHFVIAIKDIAEIMKLNYIEKELIHQLLNEKCDIMDRIDSFDQKLFTNMGMYSELRDCDECKKSVYDGEEHTCEEHELDSKLIAKTIAETLLDSHKKLVVMHFKKFITDDKSILYKHLDSLHDKKILPKFLSKSKFKNMFKRLDNIEKCVEESYGEFYKMLSNKIHAAISIYNTPVNDRR